MYFKLTNLYSHACDIYVKVFVLLIVLREFMDSAEENTVVLVFMFLT